MGIQKKQDDDDGRVIVNMDVDGMRGHGSGIRWDKFLSNQNGQVQQMTRSRRGNTPGILSLRRC